MKKDRFQDLYLQIGDTMKFEASEDEVLAALHLPSFEFEELVALSYRDPLAFAVALTYRAYNQILTYGGSDDEGFIDLEQLTHLVREQSDAFLEERATYVIERMRLHDEDQLREMAIPG